MSEFKVGDTVDPRTLPVGAVFKFSDGSMHWTVKARRKSGYLDLQSGDQAGVLTDEDSVILLSLPTPKRPPCDACGEESCPNPTCKGVETWQSEFGPAHLCRECWGRRQEQLDATIRASRTAASAAPEKPEPVVPEGLRCPFCTSRSHSFGFMNPDGTGARAIICDECDYRAPDSDWFGQPSCSSCKQPFWAGRKEVEWEHGPALCGDCLTQGHSEPADHLTNDLDTRIAEVAEPEVRIEDMPGAWESPSWEDVL